MSAAASAVLFDEALGTAGAASSLKRLVVLVEDCVETSGAFVLHHLVKRALTSPDGKGAVVFVALAQTFSHYDRVLRKLGCNLSIQRDKKKLHFFEMLKSEFSGKNDNQDGFVDLFAKIQGTLDICLSSECSMDHVTIVIDDISLLEIAARGSAEHVLDFLHYCVTLTSEMDCSLVILNHEDIYSSSGAPAVLSYMEYLADVIIKAEPLPTGLSADVHGQLTVMHPRCTGALGHPRSEVQNFHFKVKENGVDYFYPGRLA